MRTEGDEVHETTDEARAGSTPNILRWILAISLIGAIVLLSAIWIFGAWSTDTSGGEGKVVQQSQGDGSDTDSIVSDRPALVEGDQEQTDAVAVGVNEDNEAN